MRRHEFTAGRVLARELAAVQLGCGPEVVPLAVADDGSLLLEDTGFNISIAHTREGVCAVVGENIAVGIDLERVKARHPDLHRFILHPDEFGLLDTLDLDRDSILILCWSIKEAVLKGMKTGFRCSPKKLRLNIDLEQASADIIIAETDVTESDRWQCQFEKKDNSYLAIAYPKGP